MVSVGKYDTPISGSRPWPVAVITTTWNAAEQIRGLRKKINAKCLVYKWLLSRDKSSTTIPNKFARNVTYLRANLTSYWRFKSGYIWLLYGNKWFPASNFLPWLDPCNAKLASNRLSWACKGSYLFHFVASDFSSDLRKELIIFCHATTFFLSVPSFSVYRSQISPIHLRGWNFQVQAKMLVFVSLRGKVYNYWQK